VCCCF